MNGLLQVQCIDNPCVARAVCIKEKYIFFHLTHTLPLLQAGEEIDSAMKISRPSLCLSYCFCCSLYRIKSPQIIQFKHQIFVFSQDNKGKKAEETGMRFVLCTLFSRGEALALMGAVKGRCFLLHTPCKDIRGTVGLAGLSQVASALRCHPWSWERSAIPQVCCTKPV